MTYFVVLQIGGESFYQQDYMKKEGGLDSNRRVWANSWRNMNDRLARFVLA